MSWEIRKAPTVVEESRLEGERANGAPLRIVEARGELGRLLGENVVSAFAALVERWGSAWPPISTRCAPARPAAVPLADGIVPGERRMSRYV